MRVKTITPHVWSRDPALERGETDEEQRAAAEAYGKFVESGDVSALRVKEGRRVVVWRLRSLTQRAWNEVSLVAEQDVLKLVGELRRRGMSSTLLEQGTYRTYSDAARRGIAGVEGATTEDGQPLKLETDTVDGEPMLRVSAMEAIFDRFGPRLIGELGRRVLEISDLDPT